MTDAAPLVSVIVPAYNAGPYIDDCLASIRGQTYVAIEIVVIDDGSTDDTAAQADRHAAEDVRVTVLRQPNAGASAARNAGLLRAVGSFVTFFDADDVLHPHSIARRLEVFADRPAVDIVYSDHQIVDAQRRPLRVSPSLPMSARPEVDLLVCPCMGPQGVLLRRAAVDAVGPFRADIRHGEDWDYWIRLARAGKKFFHLPEVLCEYRQHATNITKQTDPCLDSQTRMLAQYRPPRHDKAARRAWRRGMYGVHRNWHWNAMRETSGVANKLWRLMKTSWRHPALLTSFPLVIGTAIRKRLLKEWS